MGAHEQCRHIMSRFVLPSDFRVVVLDGSGNVAAVASDSRRIVEALHELGYSVAAQQA